MIFLRILLFIKETISTFCGYRNQGRSPIETVLLFVNQEG